MRSILRLLLACLLGFATALPAEASVTITFWSHDMGSSFPHAFFTLRGVPDAGGAPVDVNYGFTAKTVSPAILFGDVDGRLDIADAAYMAGSDVQFAVVLSDAQYADVLRLVDEWGENGDHHYNLGKHNCVDFVQEAARRAGLAGVDQPKLMKKPKSYLLAVEAANAGRVTIIGQQGAAYLVSLAPVVATPVSPVEEAAAASASTPQPPSHTATAVETSLTPEPAS